MKTRTGYLFRKNTPEGKVSPTWYVRVMVDGKPVVRSTGTANKRKAEQCRAEMIAPYILGDRARVLKAVAAKLGDVETEQQSIAAASHSLPDIAATWKMFLASKRRPDSGEATLRQYGAEWRRFSKWLATHHPEVEHIQQVSAQLSEAYVGDMECAQMTPSTFNQHLRLLRMLWRVLEDEARLDGNPWVKITLKKGNKKANRKHDLTPAQFEALLNATLCDLDLRDLFLLLAWTGLRLADGILMKWGAVDFTSRVLTVTPKKTSRRTGQEVHIPIFPAVLAVLDRRQNGTVLDPRQQIFPELAKVYENNRSAITKRISDAFGRAGMETNEERKGRQRRAVVFGAHSLRHHFVTAATAAGMPGSMIKSITGHSTDEMLGHYQQIGKNIAAELATRIGSEQKQLAPHGSMPAIPSDNIAALPEHRDDSQREPLPDWAKDQIGELAKMLSTTTWQTVKARLETISAK